MDGILFSSIENGGVLFADKKRTASVLRPMGIYAPMELLRSGYVGSITYRGRKVNIDGVPFFRENKSDGVRRSERETGRRNAAGCFELQKQRLHRLDAAAAFLRGFQ